jgi:hypothetical protein
MLVSENHRILLFAQLFWPDNLSAGLARRSRVAARFRPGIPLPFFFEGLPQVSESRDEGPSPSPGKVGECLATSNGLSLVKYFTRIKDPKLRRSIVNLVEQIAACTTEEATSSNKCQINFTHLTYNSAKRQSPALYNKLYAPDRKPGPILEAACWVHARRPLFVMADVAENARRKSQGKTAAPISPIALEVVQRIDALFEIERSINGQTAQRRAIRRQLSAPLVADLESWMREQRAKLSRDNDVAKAMEYRIYLAS